MKSSPEPLGGAHRDPKAMSDILKEAVERNLRKIEEMDMDELLRVRYEKFRKMGTFIENNGR